MPSRPRADGIRPRVPTCFPSGRSRGTFAAASSVACANRSSKLPRLKDPAQIGALLDTLMAADWVVYSKPCLIHTASVVNYLARYSHRIALTDARILALEGDQVWLDYKDYRDGNCHKVLALAGFMRIRHFGFLANRCRAQRIEEIRAAIDARATTGDDPQGRGPSPFRRLSLS